MRHTAKVIAIGLGGLMLAVALSLGAFALAGRSVGEPATAVQITTPGATHGSKPDHHDQSETPTPTPTASPDDHGGGSSPEPGDDHGGGGGHGSDD
jgi:hypothetical protein